MVICKNILRGDLSFDKTFRDEKLKDLIRRLLAREVSKRLGCLKNGADDIKRHRFFRCSCIESVNITISLLSSNGLGRSSCTSTG